MASGGHVLSGFALSYVRAAYKRHRCRKQGPSGDNGQEGARLAAHCRRCNTDREKRLLRCITQTRVSALMGWPLPPAGCAWNTGCFPVAGSQDAQSYGGDASITQQGPAARPVV